MSQSNQTHLILNSILNAHVFEKDLGIKFKPYLSTLIYGMIGCLIGIFALSFSLKIALGLFILLILGIVGLLKPVVAAITLAFLLPFHLEWEMPQLAGIKVGTTSLLVAVGLVSIIISQFLNRKSKLPRIPHIIPWLLLALFMCAAYIHSPDFMPEPVKIPWHLYRSVFKFLLIFPLLFIFFKTKGEHLIKKIVLVLLISSMISAVVGIIQTVMAIPWHPFHAGLSLESLYKYQDLFTVDHVTGILRAFGSFTHPNAFAGFLVITIAISIGIVFTAPRDRIWYLALISGSIQIIALVCTMSRGGWVAFSCSFIILSILAQKKRPIAWGAIFIIIAMIFLPAEYKKKLSSRAQSISKPSEVEEFTFRQKRWDSFLEIALKNPILGTGVAVLNNPNEEEIGQTPHNMYLYFAVQNGIPALGMLLYFLGQLIYRSIITFRVVQNSWHKALSLGLLGGAIGLISHGFVDAQIDTEQIWTCCWLMFSMAIFLADQKKQLVHLANIHF